MTYKSLISMASRIVMIGAFITIVMPLLAAPGDFDPTWGEDGIVEINLDGTNPNLGAVADILELQDGKLFVLVAYDSFNTSRKSALLRLLEDGILDSTFGNNGIALLPLPAAVKSADFYYFRLQPDGKVVLSGTMVFFGENREIMTLVRLLPDGTPDNTFGTEGFAVLDVADLFDLEGLAYIGAEAVVQPDGKLVVLLGFTTTEYHILVRLNPDGSIDQSFGTDGIVMFQTPDDALYSTGGPILQPDGKLVVTSTKYSPVQPVVFRFNTDGSPDLSFGDEGQVLINPVELENGSSSPEDATHGGTTLLLSEGKIVISGFSAINISGGGYDRHLFNARLNSNGTLDNTFDTNGIIFPDLPYTDELTGDASLQANGKLLITGVANDPSGVPFVARFNTDGSLDTTWQGTGYQLIDTVTGYQYGSEVITQQDGKVIVGIEAYETLDVVIARLEGDPAFGYTSVSPAHLTNNVPVHANLVLNLPEPVTTHTGKIEIRRVADFSLFESLSVNDPARVSGDGTSTITVNPTTNFEPNTQYFMLVDPNTFTNAAGDPFSGVREMVEWHFTTGDASINSAPELVGIGDKSIEAEQLLTFTATATDIDGNNLIFALDDGDTGSVPTGAAITVGGEFSWTPSEAQVGEHSFDVVVTDDGDPNLTDFETITVTVTEPPFVNTAPTLTAIGSQTVEAGQVLEFVAAANDPDTAIGQVLTFTLDDGDTGSVPTGAAITVGGEFSWTPSEAQVGQHTFDVVVTDDGEPNLSDFQTITVTVTAAPVEPPTELLLNRGFENKTPSNPKRAAKWTVSNLVSADGRVCNKPNNTPPVTVAYVGKCAFQFQSSTVKTRYIEQKLSLTEALAGQTMRVAGYVKRKGLMAGATIQVQITYADNSKATLKIAIPGGTKGYKPFENTLLLEKDAKKARVRIMTGKSKGRLLVDSLSLTVSDEAPLRVGDAPILLPTAHDLRGN